MRLFHLPKRLLESARAQDENVRRRAPVLHVLFIATLGVLMFSVLLLCASYASGVDRQVLHRLLSVLLAVAVTGGLYWQLHRRRYFLAASGIISIYGVLATVMAAHWSANLPIALLLYVIVIVGSGMVLGARYAVYALLISMALLFGIEYATVTGHLHPDTTWRQMPLHLTDLAAYYLAFVILGISTWLFNRQTDAALHRALRAEVALQREKEMLEMKVAKRTRELQAAQIDKMKQLYRFAQLGQFSTSLLHDLANHMATLSIDIEGMAEQHQHSQLQTRIRRRIQYIDSMVQWAYDHINGKVQEREFSVKHEVQEVIKILHYDARQAGVQLRSSFPAGRHITLYGDPSRFRQLIVNLVSNAIDACKHAPETREHGVDVTCETMDDAVRIAVRDTGVGVPQEVQEKIFQPFYSTKHDGMGIGLFIVRQIAEEYFGGTITLESSAEGTNFAMALHDVAHT